jgi:hypothetical protein
MSLLLNGLKLARRRLGYGILTRVTGILLRSAMLC